MSLDQRDEMAARIAATLLTHGDVGPDRLARRAYDLAEALLRERARRDERAEEPLDELRRWDDPRLDAHPNDPSWHDPSWEVEPRWSREDRAALESRLAHLGPGLAAVRPQDEADERTGS